MPKLASSLANYGIEKLGTSLGLDPRISSLIGTSISSAIGAGIQNGNVFGENLIKAINDGIIKGALVLGVQAATKDLSPLIGALATRAISGGLNGLISSSHNVVGGIIGAYEDTVLHMLDPTSLIEFALLIQKKGSLTAALEAYATEYFSRDGLESIISTAGTIANYVNAWLIQPQVEHVVIRGQNGVKMPTNATGTEYIIFSEDKKQVLARQTAGLYEEGEFKVDPTTGGRVLVNGRQSFTNPDGSFGITEVKNGQYAKITVMSGAEDLVITPYGDKPLNIQRSGSDYKVINGSIEDVVRGTTKNFVDGIQVNQVSVAGYVTTEYDQGTQTYTSTLRQALLEQEYSPTGDLTLIRVKSFGAEAIDYVPTQQQIIDFRQFLDPTNSNSMAPMSGFVFTGWGMPVFGGAVATEIGVIGGPVSMPLPAAAIRFAGTNNASSTQQGFFLRLVENFNKLFNPNFWQNFFFKNFWSVRLKFGSLPTEKLAWIKNKMQGPELTSFSQIRSFLKNLAMKAKGMTIDQLISLMPKNWQVRVDNEGDGLVFYDENNTEWVRTHGPSDTAPKGKNSYDGPTYRILDPDNPDGKHYLDHYGNSVDESNKTPENEDNINNAHIPAAGNPHA